MMFETVRELRITKRERTTLALGLEDMMTGVMRNEALTVEEALETLIELSELAHKLRTLDYGDQP